jgi:hypothetical protein
VKLLQWIFTSEAGSSILFNSSSRDPIAYCPETLWKFEVDIAEKELLSVKVTPAQLDLLFNSSCQLCVFCNSRERSYGTAYELFLNYVQTG